MTRDPRLMLVGVLRAIGTREDIAHFAKGHEALVPQAQNGENQSNATLGL